VKDPFLAQLAHLPEQRLLPHHEAAVEAAAALVPRVPTPTSATTTT
jgi:hypothetical protein